MISTRIAAFSDDTTYAERASVKSSLTRSSWKRFE
jgi:hypothetical protein